MNAVEVLRRGYIMTSSPYSEEYAEALARIERLVEAVGETRAADWSDGGRVWAAYNEVISGSDA